MIAVISHPGSRHHTWKRFDNKTNAREWLDKTAAEIDARHPAFAPNAALTARIIPEKTAAKIKYRDGRPAYLHDAEYEWHAEQVG